MAKDKKKVIGIVSLGRTDYSYFKPIIQEIKREKSLDYFLILAGMHLSPEFGLTFQEISRDGIRTAEKIEITLSSNSPEGTAKTTALMMLGMAPILGKNVLDALLVLGDRYETLGAVLASLFYNIPIMHIAGGDVTEGVFDEQVRHAVTKIAHLHFTTNSLSAKRVIQMGEEPWRVFNTGSPCIDMIRRTRLYSKRDFLDLHNFDISKKLFLVTFHPVTLEVGNTERYVKNLIQALKYFDANILITYPNSDPGSRTIIEHINEFTAVNSNVRFIKNLGVKGYYSAMKYADVMVGNSSSGIIESATFKLPVVNIGIRQKSRLRTRNVIDADCKIQDIVGKIELSLSRQFKRRLNNLKNPYGVGNSSRKIVAIIKRFLSRRGQGKIITKKFIFRKGI